MKGAESFEVANNYYISGMLKFKLKQFQESEKDYDKAIALLQGVLAKGKIEDNSESEIALISSRFYLARSQMFYITERYGDCKKDA